MRNKRQAEIANTEITRQMSKSENSII